MRIEEAILFLAVVALSLALVLVVVAPILRQKRRASRLAGAETAASDVAFQSGPQTCSACHRHHPAAFRFCPFDGTPLGLRLPIDRVQGGASVAQDVSGATSAIPGGKICPNCSRRYRLDTAICPRDGAPLVAVN